MSSAKQDFTSYTYEDYCSWETDERYELIDGVPYAMAAPLVRHQRASGKLLQKIANHIDQKGGSCEIFHAPFDVRLSHDKGDDTVVQPDLVIICDPKKIEDGKSCKGAPDLVIEILSPSNTYHDRIVKFAKYREAKVKEIWFLDLETKTIEIYIIDKESGNYMPHLYLGPVTVPVGILPGLFIDMKDIFGD
jgi:Uma2 family endonuclease